MKVKQFLAVFVFLIFWSCSMEDESLHDLIIDNPMNHSVSIEEAQTELESLLDFFYSYDSRSEFPERRIISERYTINEVPSSRSDSSSVSKVIHVFNFEKEKGFALMAGDDRMPSLLGYSNQGNLRLNVTLENLGFISFLDNLDQLMDLPDNELIYHGTGPMTYYSDFLGKGEYTYSYGPWENYLYNESGNCLTKWGQGPPYNNHCPLVSEGKHCLTGCVTTAVAQLMSIYKHPKTYKDLTLDWNSMININLLGPIDNDADTVISVLMRELGKKENLNVKYGENSSSAKDANIPRTLSNFGYSNGGKISPYNIYKVIPEVENGNGVLMGGYSREKKYKIFGWTIASSYSGGHEWLVHGMLERRRYLYKYDRNGQLVSRAKCSTFYPQCNWGWSGHRDGYYFYGNFDTNSGPVYPESRKVSRSDVDYNYRYELTMITGIRK